MIIEMKLSNEMYQSLVQKYETTIQEYKTTLLIYLGLNDIPQPQLVIFSLLISKWNLLSKIPFL